MLVPQISSKLFLVNFLHHVSLSKFFPLKLIDINFMDSSKLLSWNIEASFLSTFKSLKTHIAKAK